jgi:phage shock protein E
MFFTNYRCNNINAHALNDLMQSGREFMLLDVRTPQENAEQAIENSLLIPVQELAYRMRELPKDKDIVVYCRIGNRSAYACALLASHGYRVQNLEGGILVWNAIANISNLRS